ncbi:unnamed protein product [Linum trigynum]|uniref:Endonuclease/exonuclease/phosphatase domain-containing protein n=1 Tax=Linum trigynum TaxID=586398 RepID=A0AAV2DCW4_9ROSI
MESAAIVWNVRGLGNRDKRARVKRLIGSRKPKIVGLVETKWDSCDDSKIRSIGGSTDLGWIAKNAAGSAGGIAVYWDKLFYNTLSSREGRHFLEVEFQEKVSQKIWHLVVVYGPQDREDKIDFLNEIRALCHQCQAPMCIAGDFNLVRSHDEYRGARRNHNLMEEFNSVIDECGLMELPLGDSSFTWCKGGDNNCLSRIDRVFVSVNFDILFPDCSLVAMDRIESDHSQLLIKWGEGLRVHRPWKFENMWLEDNRFYMALAEWLNTQIQGRGMVFKWARRLQDLKNRIKVWNKEVFGDMNKKLDDLIAENRDINQREEERMLTTEEVRRRDCILIEIGQVLNLLEISWRQKSRELWLSKGDRNSGFFHRVANFKRKVNRIVSITINGMVTKGREEVALGVVEYYKRLFCEDLKKRHFPSQYDCFKITDEEAQFLSRRFSELEVWESIADCDGGKARGPDGFTWEFYKKTWNLIKPEIMLAFGDFFNSGYLPFCASHSFICLVPKKDTVVDIKDLRPISLMGSFNKLVSKVLARRLGSVIVTQNQHASVRGRQIGEAGLIAFELVDSRKKSRRPV